MNRGIWYGVWAYALWGLVPVYWKWIAEVPATQLIGHRIVWSFLLLAAITALSRHRKGFAATALTLPVVRIYSVASVLIAVNWLTYIWAVNKGFIVQTSLGYFINPLFNVVLGVLVLREQLRPLQWVAVGLATTGVLYLTIVHGALPWISLTLAVTFGLYGLVKKRAPLGSVSGLTVETGLLLPVALLYLFYADRGGHGAFLHGGSRSDLLMVGTGLVTTIPLIFFASAVQRIPLTLLGILQYVAPTMQFLLGVLVYKEPFTRTQFVGFACVWSALLVFGLEGFIAHRLQPVTTILDEGAG